MDISVPVGFGRMLSVSVQLCCALDAHPLAWPKRKQKALAAEINEFVSTGYALGANYDIVNFGDHRIGRIKACRFILMERGLEGGLKVSKDFVDVAFDASGKIVL